jgi:hypothetical protein
MNKAVIFAPFWQQVGHVGNYRVDRFVRWLTAAGFYVVLVRIGSITEVHPKSWGVELTVKDPLGRSRNVVADGAPVKISRTKSLRRWLSNWLFSPDHGIVWARAAARSPIVLEHAAGAAFVLSSSPPESAHIGAAKLAQKLGAKLIIDMRDGWVDEPLKSYLRNSKLLRWRESKLESTILGLAGKIFVTSPMWKLLLEDRLPFTKAKTVVLTNGYAPKSLFSINEARVRSADGSLSLIHAGRFTGSRDSQKISYLLEPLLCGIEGGSTKGVITLLGKLEWEDLVEVEDWRPRFEAQGWSIDVKAAVSREKMMAMLGEADGLLLLAAGQAAIPGKLYEYLAVRKPVFVSTPKGSAVRTIGESLPQLFLIDHTKQDQDVARSFLAACGRDDNHYVMPPHFSEETLSRIFLDEIL